VDDISTTLNEHFSETMRLLITADLHFRLHWFRWLITQAPDFDLVCIAGDLLDMFNPETRIEQSREIARLLRELADIITVALCSGNHDNAGRLVSHDRASVYGGFIELGMHPNIITDGSTRKLESLIVTTVPYHCSRQEKSIWLDRGSAIRRQTGMPWIVLHHVPAKIGSGVSGEESEAAELLTTYRPNYFVSGHDHAFPYTSGQGWNQKLGAGKLAGTGSIIERAISNHIKLDTESGELSWHTASDKWIPKDGLYDRLVLKLAKD
jgi:predicted MPP superfamily phosphohydrolase